MPNKFKGVIMTKANPYELNSAFLGVPVRILMENAGSAVARVISENFEKNKQICILSGPGNNGGDGLVAARHLASLSYRVSLVLAVPPKLIKTEEARENWEIIRNMRESIETIYIKSPDDLKRVKEIVKNSDIIVDALLGTGITRELRYPYKELVEIINNSKKVVVSVDIPTGLNPLTGRPLGVAVKANITVTFHKLKPGLGKSREYTGKIIIASIGVPPEAEIFAGPGDVAKILPWREPWSHKGDYGRVLVVGGSLFYSGAPALSALAAISAGVDIVLVLTPRKVAPIVKSYSPLLIVNPLSSRNFLSLDDVSIILEYASKMDSILLGPGLGLEDETLQAIAEVINHLSKNKKSLTIDADAIKAVAKYKPTVGGNTVITPHEAEFHVLSNFKPPRNRKERIKVVKEVASKLGCTILLKGYDDYISDGRSTKINSTGNPGMTSGGTGDVLSGLVAAFQAYGASPFDAAVAAAFINGSAGDIAYTKKGSQLTATDLIEEIPKLLKSIGDGVFPYNSVRRPGEG